MSVRYEAKADTFRTQRANVYKHYELCDVLSCVGRLGKPCSHELLPASRLVATFEGRDALAMARSLLPFFDIEVVDSCNACQHCPCGEWTCRGEEIGRMGLWAMSCGLVVRDVQAECNCVDPVGVDCHGDL